MTDIVPLERLNPPSVLNGASGANRQTGSSLILANNDLEAIEYWLSQYEDNQHTYRGFRREAERLILWALYVQQTAVSSLTGEDLKIYREFLLSPPDDWCYSSGRAPRRDSPEWRPFGGPLKASSVMTAMNTIRALYTFLLENGYIRFSPFAQKGLSRVIKSDARLQFQKEKDNVLGRALEDSALDLLIEEALRMPNSSPKMAFKKERALFLLQFGIFLAPRLSEMANAQMCDFSVGKAGKWWWRVIGKGGKVEDVPIRPEMLEALTDWRKAISSMNNDEAFSSLPEPSERTPVFRRLNGVTGLSSASLYAIIKDLAGKASEKLDVSSAEYQQLNNMSPHWLRHTAITQLANAKTRDRYLQSFARHSKRETTEIYITDDAEQFHDEISGRR